MQGEICIGVPFVGLLGEIKKQTFGRKDSNALLPGGGEAKGWEEKGPGWGKVNKKSPLDVERRIGWAVIQLNIP